MLKNFNTILITEVCSCRPWQYVILFPCDPGAVCVHPWCCSGVPHLWGHPNPSLRTHWCHWQVEAEGQWNWEDRIRDPVPCMSYSFDGPLSKGRLCLNIWRHMSVCNFPKGCCLESYFVANWPHTFKIGLDNLFWYQSTTRSIAVTCLYLIRTPLLKYSGLIYIVLSVHAQTTSCSAGCTHTHTHTHTHTYI